MYNKIIAINNDDIELMALELKKRIPADLGELGERLTITEIKKLLVLILKAASSGKILLRKIDPGFCYERNPFFKDFYPFNLSASSEEERSAFPKLKKAWSDILDFRYKVSGLDDPGVKGYVAPVIITFTMVDKENLK